MAYTPTVWKNGEFPPIDAEHLNKIEQGIANSAPGGFGLGGNAKWLTEADDVNAISESGWYAWDSPHTPKNAINLAYSTIMRVDAENAAVNTKTLYGVADNLLGAAIVARNMTYGSHISDWEYENPPMALGTEYRTTERYFGRPVYTKAVNFGSMPNNSAKSVSHGIANMDVCFMVYGHDTLNHQPIPTMCLSGNFTEQVGITVTGSEIIIHTTFDAANDEAIVVLKYTKTTD